jgi:hypothetical protein
MVVGETFRNERPPNNGRRIVDKYLGADPVVKRTVTCLGITASGFLASNLEGAEPQSLNSDSLQLIISLPVELSLTKFSESHGKRNLWESFYVSGRLICIDNIYASKTAQLRAQPKNPSKLYNRQGEVPWPISIHVKLPPFNNQIGQQFSRVVQ